MPTPPAAPLNGYYNACAYPYVSPEMFETTVYVSMETGAITPIESLNLGTAPFSKLLPGSDLLLPSYDVKLTGQDDPLRDRIALIAIGSNSSPDVLVEKFRKAQVGGSFVTAQALLIDHAVVHGAFIGAKGTIPATVIPDRRTTTAITVSLLTMEQAEALTATEPNYDLVLSEDGIPLHKMTNNPVLRGGALLYVSIWGALRSEPNSPDAIALNSIPSVTPLPKLTSEQIVQRVAEKLGHRAHPEAFFNTLPTLPLEQRLGLIQILQQDAIPASIHGKQVKASTIGRDAAALGVEVPAIRYL